MEQVPRRVVIVGGGFAGVRAGLDLAGKKLSNTKVTLVTDKPHFEYHAALYRVVTGRSPLEVCIPLREIFGTDDKDIEILVDEIVSIDTDSHRVIGKSGSDYVYDELVLALGSETAHFNIPGLRELSYGFKSIQEALRLKQHLHEMFSSCEKISPEDRVCAAHIVVVGGGASGVELAGELALYTKKLARHHGLDQSLVTIDLIETAPRLLPALDVRLSLRVLKRLRDLGVNIFLNRTIVHEEIETLYMKDMEMKTKTVVWTAGVKPHALYAKLAGVTTDKKGRVVVDEYLRAEGLSNVYVVGDGASTQFSGMAQTALADGAFVAHAIAGSSRTFFGRYTPKRPHYAVPVGPGWAAVQIGSMRFYGTVGWWLRRLADLRFYLSILPTGKAVVAFRARQLTTEVCPLCTQDVLRVHE